MENPQGQIKLSFSCKENLASMPSTETGKYCDSCKREIIDFTSMSFTEIQRIRSSESNVCGYFRPDQIEPKLHPIQVPKVRSLAFLSTLLLSLNFSSASAQSTVDPKVEQSQGTSNAPNLTQKEAQEKAERGEHISMSRASVEQEDEPSISEKDLRKQDRMRRKNWYWSKRFPFLHRKRYWVGKF